MITGFVLVMMLVVEYLNVLSRGRIPVRLAERRWRQYLLAAALGAASVLLPRFTGRFSSVAVQRESSVNMILQRWSQNRAAGGRSATSCF